MKSVKIQTQIICDYCKTKALNRCNFCKKDICREHRIMMVRNVKKSKYHYKQELLINICTQCYKTLINTYFGMYGKNNDTKKNNR